MLDYMHDDKGVIMAETKEKWIQNAINPKHKGALHKELGVKPGKKIPAKKLAKAEKSKNPRIRKQADLAETLKKLRRTG
jgi:hypothetical protein